MKLRLDMWLILSSQVEMEVFLGVSLTSISQKKWFWRVEEDLGPLMASQASISSLYYSFKLCLIWKQIKIIKIPFLNFCYVYTDRYPASRMTITSSCWRTSPRRSRNISLFQDKESTNRPKKFHWCLLCGTNGFVGDIAITSVTLRQPHCIENALRNLPASGRSNS